MTLQWDKKALNSIKGSREVAQELMEDGWKVATVAAQLAPKDTGRGAKSIHPELVKVRGEVEVHISWDRRHFYMSFSELGTEHQKAHPFLRPAAHRFQ